MLASEGLADVKLKWLCFPSSRITQGNLIMIRWKNAIEIHSSSHSSITIPILLFPLPLLFPWYRHCHSYSHGNHMESQLFPFPCTPLIHTSVSMNSRPPIRTYFKKFKMGTVAILKIVKSPCVNKHPILMKTVDNSRFGTRRQSHD